MDTFTELLDHDPENLKVLLDTVKLRIRELHADTSTHVKLVGWEEVLERALNDVLFEKNLKNQL